MKLFRESDPYLLHSFSLSSDLREGYSTSVVMHAVTAGILGLELISTEVYPDDIPTLKYCISHEDKKSYL